MKLYYHKGKNFGDQLNPMIFDYFLPNFFNDKEDESLFVGIGSLIGLVSRFPQKKIVFSSGLADGDASTYGPVPEDLSSFDFVCVRGPLTAQRLGLDPELAITDGAILLAAMPIPLTRTEEVISFMPHAGSEHFFDHQKLADALGWQLISPTESPDEVLQKMMRSSFVVTEAMHGAIVADSLRIPWIPYVGFSTINAFKWKDWCASMELNYQPLVLKPYFDTNRMRMWMDERFGQKGMKWLIPLAMPIANGWMKWRWRKNLKSMQGWGAAANVQLSKEEIFQDRLKCMLDRVNWVKENKKQWEL